MTYCPVCHSTDFLRGAHYGEVLICAGCLSTLSVRMLKSADPLPSADEMVAVAEAIVRGRA